MSALAAVALGAVAGAAIWAGLVVTVPARPDLSKTLDALTSPDNNPGVGQGAGSRGLAVARRLGILRGSVRADLDTLDQREDEYVRRLARLVMISAAIPVAVALLLAVTGTAVSVPVTGIAIAAFAVLAWAAVEIELRTRSAKARTEAVRALAVVLSLTAMALSGGAGIDSALRAAAGAGTGIPFARIKAALDRAALLGRTPWDTLGELGERLGVDAYTQLAATTALAGTEGARIRASLVDRSNALRTQRLADIEADALAATERMSLPIVAMASAFVVIVGYPALERIMTGL
jgi:Flp pilus assembly protein TadB